MALVAPIVVSLPTVVSALAYETFLMQVLGHIIMDMYDCPPEFLRDIDKERRMLCVDFVMCGLMN